MNKLILTFPVIMLSILGLFSISSCKSKLASKSHIVEKNNVERYAEKLKLDNIYNGFDSLQIRIWREIPEGSDSVILVVMKQEKGNWSASKYDIITKYDDATYKTFVDSYKSVDLKPRTSGANLMKELLNEKIESLPESIEIDSKDIFITDGIIYTIELSKIKSYKCMTYINPDVYSSKHWYVKNFINILKIVDKEFLTNIYSPL